MKRLLCLGLICCVLLWGGSAWALSLASTDCYLDWNRLSITGGSYNLIGNEYTYLRADARNDFQDIEGDAREESGLWGEYGVVTSTNTPLAVGIAQTGMMTVNRDGINKTFDGLLGSTLVEADGGNSTTAGATANVRRSGSIRALNDATYEFSLDYYIFHDLSTEYFGEDASAYSFLTFSLTQGHYDSEGKFIVDYRVEDSATDPGTGTLTFTADLVSGKEYGFEADIYTTVNAYSPAQAAPVPEPSTMVLMGLGLMGLAGMGRKRLKN